MTDEIQILREKCKELDTENKELSIENKKLKGDVEIYQRFLLKNKDKFSGFIKDLEEFFYSMEIPDNV